MILSQEILIEGKYKVNNLISVEVNKSVNQISDNAILKLPLKLENGVNELPKDIKYGSKITIQLGYQVALGGNKKDVLNKEFKGYITSIKQNKEIEIHCEDNAFLLRKDIQSKQYKNITLKELFEDIVSQIENIDVIISKELSGLKYDKFTIKDATAFEVIEKIKEEFNIHIFFRGNTLYANLKYELKEGEVNYDFSKNVEKVDLKWEDEQDRKVLVEVIGIDKMNKKVSVIVGDKGGDKIKINRYNVMDEKTLKSIGNQEIKKYKIDGYKGSITTWLLPYCSYGYSAKIYDKDFPKREGHYYVENVTTKFSSSGGGRKIGLGIKLDK